MTGATMTDATMTGTRHQARQSQGISARRPAAQSTSAPSTSTQPPPAQVRLTKQREAILAETRRVSGFRSAQQLHADLAGQGIAIGLATVYRALQALAGAGLLDQVRSDDGESLYRHCETVKHHHHLMCRQCGAAREIEGAALESFLQAVGQGAGYTDLEHEVTVWGTCATCANRAGAGGGDSDGGNSGDGGGKLGG